MSNKLRRNINKLVLPTAAAIALGGVGMKMASKPSGENEATASASGQFCSTGNFSSSAEGLGVGLANQLIKLDLEQAAKGISVAGTDVTDTVKNMPRYNAANEALDMAGYNTKVIPDAGDKLEVCVAVTAKSDNTASYKVISSEITDLPNNQE